MEIKGAVVVITGASSGIGRECALAFARAGARLILGARRRDRLEEIKAEIDALGGVSEVEAVDVARQEDVQRLVGAAVSRFGGLDVLVNNAGYGVHGRVEDTPAEAFLGQMRVNYMGTVFGCQAAVPLMRQQGRGVIVNVSSIVGHRAMPGGSGYAASKAAQVSLSEALRVELSGTGVSVCCVHPIGTETEFRDRLAQASGASIKGIGPQQKASAVARTVLRCVRHPRPEAYPFPPSRALVWLNAFFPAWVDRLAARSARRSGRL
jgi:NAD(P)-dependent dehydrogenase (short-subunit alcohol dehydrogenase family)